MSTRIDSSFLWGVLFAYPSHRKLSLDLAQMRKVEVCGLADRPRLLAGKAR